VTTRICIACRTLYDAGQQCPGGRGHVVVELSREARKGRAKLLDEVWGPDSRARALRNAAKAGAGGGGIGSLVEGCTGCDGLAGGGEAAAIVLAILAFAIVAVVLVWAIMKLIELVRAWRDTPKPHGALLAPPKARGRRVGTGIVQPGGALPTPWTEGHVSAYAFELHARSVFGGAAMLRDARTAGFDVKLDDGRVVRVPAGRLHVGGRRARHDVDEARMGAFLAALGEGRGAGEASGSEENDDRELFPHDHARAVVVRPGDRVDVFGEVRPVADAAGSVGYRGNAMVLAPVGTPVVRVRAGDARVRVDDAPGAAADTADARDDVDEVADRAAGA
jgi:hypothetical protein